uniref:Uncharacterized protein n=1 Tax=Romanomermis culicivorax TaxID=13658 RepID=A0A915IN37_ROMCU
MIKRNPKEPFGLLYNSINCSGRFTIVCLSVTSKYINFESRVTLRILAEKMCGFGFSEKESPLKTSCNDFDDFCN